MLPMTLFCLNNQICLKIIGKFIYLEMFNFAHNKLICQFILHQNKILMNLTLFF
jgi:hypothetical protein